MAVAVHAEPRAGRPSVSHHPQTHDAVARVKHAYDAEEEESPFLLSIDFGREGAGGVDCSLNLSPKASTELRITACVFAGYFKKNYK